MGTMTFLLPPGLTPAKLAELQRACVAGGPDNMPWPTEVRIEPAKLIVRREVDESGTLVVPWEIDGVGRLMGTTATLIEQPSPYPFRIELARGKVHQLRCQAAEWQAGGLEVPDTLSNQIRQASVAFARAVTQDPSDASRLAEEVLSKGYRTAEQLVGLYVAKMFELRHQRQPQFETLLGCCLGGHLLPDEQAESLCRAGNSVCLSLNWKEVEPAEASYQWAPFDAHLQWAREAGLTVTAGPLIDFSAARLPDWLWLWERDLQSLSSFMCDYVATAIRRYKDKIRSWQVCAATNSSSVLGLGEDELLWLTARLVETARQIEPNLELSLGIAQPWGEYMAVEDRTHSPFIFADTLIRSGLSLAALDLELVMGVTPRASYCRDVLEGYRLLYLYSLLGVPLRVTLGYPSGSEHDEQSNPEMKVAAGHWHAAASPENQADWASAFASLALCMPSVRSVQWVHCSDAETHQFPNCGLFDAEGNAKPVLETLRRLREQHLR